MGIFGSRGPVFPSQQDGEPDVQDKAGEKTNTGDPDSGSVEEAVKEFGVFIEGFRSDENEKVPGEVSRQEENEGETGDCDDEFAADRGFDQGTQGTGGSTHGSRERPSGAPGGYASQWDLQGEKEALPE